MSAFSDAAKEVTPKKRGGTPCSVCHMLEQMDNQSRIDAIEAMAGPGSSSWLAGVFNAMGHDAMNAPRVGHHRRSNHDR